MGGPWVHQTRPHSLLLARSTPTKTLLQTPPDATLETHNYGHENVLYARRWRPWAWAVRTYIKLGMNRPPSLAPALFPAAKTQDEAMVDSGRQLGTVDESFCQGASAQWERLTRARAEHL